MDIEVKGRNWAVTDEVRERIEKRFSKVGQQVSPLARLEVELRQEAQPVDRGVPDRRGHPVPQGRHPAHARRDARHGPLGERLRRRPRPTGQAPPRQAPQPPRAARGERRRGHLAGDLTTLVGGRRSRAKESRAQAVAGGGPGVGWEAVGGSGSGCSRKPWWPPTAAPPRGLRGAPSPLLALPHVDPRSRPADGRGPEVPVL